MIIMTAITNNKRSINNNDLGQCWQGTGLSPCCTWSMQGWSGPSRLAQKCPHRSTRRPRSQIWRGFGVATQTVTFHNTAPFCFSLYPRSLFAPSLSFPSQLTHFIISASIISGIRGCLFCLEHRASGINIPRDVCSVLWVSMSEWCPVTPGTGWGSLGLLGWCLAAPVCPHPPSPILSQTRDRGRAPNITQMSGMNVRKLKHQETLDSNRNCLKTFTVM